MFFVVVVVGVFLLNLMMSRLKLTFDLLDIKIVSLPSYETCV